MRIVVGICGGIAAYKSIELVRLLIKAGHEVQTVLTENAQQFVTETTLQAVSGRAVRRALWDHAAEAAMGHIELARWAEAIIIAPATANTLAKLSQGMADDLLCTLCLATKAKIFFAPAMNQQMHVNWAVQENLSRLQRAGLVDIGTAVGAQACGDVGPGRMLEPEQIVQAVFAQLKPEQILLGKKVLISAGPTLEDLDPVRFIGNRSSGKMGYALAEAAHGLGADVTLISGPCKLMAPTGCKLINIRSALDLLTAMRSESLGLSTSDIIVAAAAVADYRPAHSSTQKIKKTGENIQLELVKNPDVIATIASELRKRGNCPLLIGFAAETEQVLEHARGKLQRKHLDWIAANQVSTTLGMDADDNALTLISAKQQIELGQAKKSDLAQRFWRALLADHWPECA